MRVILILCAVLVSACAPRQVAQFAEPAEGTTVQPIYVASELSLDHSEPVFGRERTGQLNYFRADVSIPPTHQPGKIEWPKGTPDASRDFVLTGQQNYTDAARFTADIRNHHQGNETVVFVHGYNNTLSEVLYRFAQIQVDFASELPSVLFAWPSAGDPRGYVYDRDSVLFARDDLYGLLKDLSAKRSDKLVLVAHSMGSQLVMEVLRQAALRGDKALLRQINSVVLLSPDIDTDLFRRQAATIGDLPQPFLIFVSQNDKVLGLASLISGRKPRLGVVSEPSAVDGLDVQLIDVSDLSDGAGLDHAVAVTSPAAISVLRGMIDQAQSGKRAFRRYLKLKPVP